jgi:hypothetical protein
MIRFADPQEQELYRLRKSKMPILFMIVFFPIWLYFAVIFLKPAWQFVFANAPDIPSSEIFLAGMIGLLVFIPLVLVIAVSYLANQLIITDQRIYIRRGLTGRTYIVNQQDVRSFQHVVSSGRNQTNHKIHLYLANGTIVKTGELFITLHSLKALLELLRSRYEGRGFTRQELLQMKQQSLNTDQPMVQTNLALLLLVLAPWLLAAMFAVFYLLR